MSTERNRRTMGEVKTDPRLLALLERARDHKMTPAEIDAQRRSWVRGEMMLDHPEITAEQADETLRKVMGPPLAEQLATARADGRREGLEMAAKLADQWSEARLDEANAPIISGDVFADDGVFVQSTADANAGYRLMDLATAIRALMEKEGS